MNRFLRTFPILLWLIGLLFAFYPTVFSGFERVPGDLCDSRLLNYLLEHGYRWLNQEPQHRDFWSPPFFYPQRNVAAYTDVLISGLPIYACWRIFDLSPITSFQLAFIAAATLNYWMAFLLLRRRLGFAAHASALGAFVFAFSCPRLWHVNHFQLQLHFYTLFALYALHVLWTRSAASEKSSTWSGNAWVAVFCLSTAAQLFASFYLGWFFGLVLIVATFWALCFAETRCTLLRLLRDNAWIWCIWGAVAAAAAWHLAAHYLEAVRVVGYQEPHQILWGVPYPIAWWSRGVESYVGVTNTIYWLGWVDKYPMPNAEHAMGIGTVTWLLAVLGLWQLRNVRGFKVLALTGLTLAVLMTRWSPTFSLWEHVYPYVPGGAAIRVVCRIKLLALIPLGIGLAQFVHSRQRLRSVCLVAVVCLAEQIGSVPAYPQREHHQRVSAIVEKIPIDAQAFFYVAKLPADHAEPRDLRFHVDAMWAALETGFPTVNGYSGRLPPDWDLEDNYYETPTGKEVITRLLRRWCNEHGLNEDAVAIVVTTPPH